MHQRCYGDLLDSRSNIAIIRGKNALLIRPTWASRVCDMFNGNSFATRETVRGRVIHGSGVCEKTHRPGLT